MATTASAPMFIQRRAGAPHILLSSPPSRPGSPGPPPPSPASVSRVAPLPSRRAVFDLRSNSPLSPSAGDKTLLRAQLERAKQNKVLLRSGKKARPLSQRELRRLAAEENGESSPAATVDGETTGSLTPLSMSDSDRASTVALIGWIEGILTVEEEAGPMQHPFPTEPLSVATPAANPLPDSAGSSDNAASAEQSPSNSPPRRTSRPHLSHRISRTAPTTPSISPTSHISTLLSRRPSVKVDLSTAFATGLVVSASGSGSTASARQALGKTRSLPPVSAISATTSLPGSRRSSVPSSPLLTPLKLPFSRPPSLPSPKASNARRRHLSAGGSTSSASSPISPPKQSVMSSDPRDLTLQFTRRNRPDIGPRTLSTSSVSSLLFARRASHPELEEDCETTEPDGSEPDEADTTRTGPFFEPSVFASPPLYTSSATSYKSSDPRGAGSTSYWSIHSSASSQHTRAATSSSIASVQSRPSETSSPSHRRSDSALPKSRSPAKTVLLQPTGLVQAMPISPGVPLEAAWLPGPLPAQPSQLSLAHPARVLQHEQQQQQSLVPSRAAASHDKGKASAGVDLQRLRRDQLARRRAMEADEEDKSSSETAPADDEAEVVAADESPALKRGSPVREHKEASSWEDEHIAGPSQALGALSGGTKSGGGRRSPLLLRRSSAKRGGARM